MKRLRLLTGLYAIGIVISACSPKVTAAVTTTTPVVSSTDVSSAQVDAAKTKYPDATIDALKKGQDIYYGTCTNCHGAKKITNFSEEELPEIIDNMARKAKISAEEKDAVLKYVIGVKLASAK
jgi:cytochrome c5